MREPGVRNKALVGYVAILICKKKQIMIRCDSTTNGLSTVDKNCQRWSSNLCIFWGALSGVFRASGNSGVLPVAHPTPPKKTMSGSPACSTTSAPGLHPDLFFSARHQARPNCSARPASTHLTYTPLVSASSLQQSAICRYQVSRGTPFPTTKASLW